jgi:sugar diacid utilization regulator
VVSTERREAEWQNLWATEADEAEWIVRFAQAIRNLRETSPALESEVQTRVWGMGDYDEHHLDPIELSSRIRFNVDWLLGALADPEQEIEHLRGWAEVSAVADGIGERRAVQGVGIDAVIRSWRTAERVLEERIVALGDEVPAIDLLAAVRKLGRLIGALTDRSIDAYRRVQQEVTGHYDRLTTDLVARIVSGTGLSQSEIEERSALIQADPTDEYVAVVIGISERDRAASLLQAQRHLLGHLGMRVTGRTLVGSIDDRPLLLVPARRIGADGIRSFVEWAHASAGSLRPLTLGLSAGRAPLGRSHETARQARIAVEVAERLHRDDEVVSYTDVAVEALLLREPETADLILGTIAPLLRRPELVDTLRAYLATGHSARAAARRLYVHPNTVPHRLRSIERILGRDLTDVPSNLDLALALRCLDLRRSEERDRGPEGDADSLARPSTAVVERP